MMKRKNRNCLTIAIAIVIITQLVTAAFPFAAIAQKRDSIPPE